MTNAEIKAQMNEIYNVWWRKYCKVQPVTESVMDEAYESGKSIVDKLKSELVFGIWFFLMKELEKRWKEAGNDPRG